jgi:hypothetical protein
LLQAVIGRLLATKVAKSATNDGRALLLSNEAVAACDYSCCMELVQIDIPKPGIVLLSQSAKMGEIEKMLVLYKPCPPRLVILRFK